VFIAVAPHKRLDGDTLSPTLARFGGFAAAGQHADRAVFTDADSGEEQLLVLRAVAGRKVQMDHPLILAMARSTRQILEPWSERSGYYSMTLLALALAGSGLLVLSQRRRVAAGDLATQAQREREDSTNRLEIALRGADLGLWDIDLSTGRMVVNQRECDMLGFASSEELCATPWREYVHPEDASMVRRATAAYLRGRTPAFECEHRMRHRNGSWIWVLSKAVVTQRGADRKPLRVIGTHLDITERRSVAGDMARMNDALKVSEARLSMALEGSSLALFDWDIRANRLYTSAHAAALRGEPPLESATTLEESARHVHPDDLPSMLGAIGDTLSGRSGEYNLEYRLRQVDGSWIWVRAKGRIVERDAAGRPLRLAGTYANINERKLAEDQLRHMAEFDALTDLPNRATFTRHLQQALERAQRNGPLALLFLDIDRFKEINDTLGHEAGDVLLKEFARRMRANVRQSDMVARLAGDEFTIVLERVRDAADAASVAQKVVAALREPLHVRGRVVTVTCSVGTALPSAGDDAQALLRRADAALYEAKRRGRDGYVVAEASSA